MKKEETSALGKPPQTEETEERRLRRELEPAPKLVDKGWGRTDREQGEAVLCVSVRDMSLGR